MKILVTVGTTKYDSLIKYMDTEHFFLDFSIDFQIANGKYIPKNHSYFRFLDSKNIENKYMESDIIITHAGAGTIYKLLEMGKKFIVVPNLERSDKHQLDIANFLIKNKLTLVAYNMAQLGIFIDIIQNFNFKPFNKDDFFKSSEIINYLIS